MSMVTYLASNALLPEGDFISAPDAIYGDYAAYRQSKDYIEIKEDHIYVSPPYDFAEELHKSNIPVHVYQDDSKSISIHLCNYNPPTRILPDIDEEKVAKEVQMQFLCDQDVTGQFSLPYVYYLGYSPTESVLREYLCTHIKSNEKVEIYKCWAGSESEMRDSKWDITVRLQEFAESGSTEIASSEYAEKFEKHFVTYIAPLTCNIRFNYFDKKPVILIFKGKKEELIPYEIAEMILGEYK